MEMLPLRHDCTGGPLSGMSGWLHMIVAEAFALANMNEEQEAHFYVEGSSINRCLFCGRDPLSDPHIRQVVIEEESE